MNTQFLNDLGITDKSVIDAIFAENGKDVNRAKNDYFELKNKLEEANIKLSETSKEYLSLKNATSDYNSLKERVSTLESENKSYQESWQEKINQIKKEHAVESCVRDAKARNAKAVMALIDMNKITYQDGELSGISEQLESLIKNEETSFLFGDGKITGKSLQKPDYEPSSTNRSLGEILVEKMNL